MATENRQAFAVLHIPHASTVIPGEARASIGLSDGALSLELRRMTDSFTDELFRLESRVACAVVFPVSRLVVDPERFLDDDQEPMAARGMGVIYTRTSDGRVLRSRLDEWLRHTLIDAYYRPHHQALTHAVDGALNRHGRCLVIDCHSFPAVPLPYETEQSPERPEICLGTDAFHSPKSLVHAASDIFHAADFEVFLNRPFAGALVPAKHYRRDTRVIGLMVEVNRRLYMDEDSGERLASFPQLAARLQSCLRQLIKSAGSIAPA